MGGVTATLTFPHANAVEIPDKSVRETGRETDMQTVGTVTMDQAKAIRTTGVTFTNPRGMVGEVIAELSPRGKSQARFTCKCGAVHVREISDWHHTLHCPKCMGKSGAKRAGAVANAAASLMAQDPELMKLQEENRLMQQKMQEMELAKAREKIRADLLKARQELEARLAALQG